MQPSEPEVLDDVEPPTYGDVPRDPVAQPRIAQPAVIANKTLLVWRLYLVCIAPLTLCIPIVLTWLCLRAVPLTDKGGISVYLFAFLLVYFLPIIVISFVCVMINNLMLTLGFAYRQFTWAWKWFAWFSLGGFSSRDVTRRMYY